MYGTKILFSKSVKYKPLIEANKGTERNKTADEAAWSGEENELAIVKTQIQAWHTKTNIGHAMRHKWKRR